MTKRSSLFGFGFVCALVVALSGAHAADKEKKVDMKKVPPASTKKGVAFETDIKPILEKSCVKCHSGDKPKSKYRMDSLASVIKGGESGDPAPREGC